MALATTAWQGLQHLAAHVEGSERPHEVQPAQPLFVHSISVGTPLQSLIQVNTPVPATN